jgi:hypothetical protein
LTANYAGRRSVIIHDQRVGALVDRIRAERRGPTRNELLLLRAAIHEASQRGALAQLEVWGAGGSGDILSADGLRILTYLENRPVASLPFNSFVAMVTAIVEYGDAAA